MGLNDVVDKIVRSGKHTKFILPVFAAGASQPVLAQDTEKQLDNNEPYDSQKDKSLFSPVSFYGQLRHVQHSFKPLISSSDFSMRLAGRPNRTLRLFGDVQLGYAYGENDQGGHLGTFSVNAGTSLANYFNVEGAWLFARGGPTYTFEKHQGLMDVQRHLYGGEAQLGLVIDRFMTDVTASIKYGIYEGNISNFDVKGDTSQFRVKQNMRIPLPIKQLAIEQGLEYQKTIFAAPLQFEEDIINIGGGFAISPLEALLLKPGLYFRLETEKSGLNKERKNALGAQLIIVYQLGKEWDLKLGGCWDSELGLQAYVAVVCGF